MTRLRPIYATAAVAVAGIAFADRWTLPATFAFAGAAILAVLCAVVRSARGPLALAAVFLLAAGGLRLGRETRTPPRPGWQSVLGDVAGPPRRSRERWSYPVRAAGFGVQVFQTGGDPPGWGDRVRLEGELRRPEPPTNPGQFDYGRYLRRQGIDAIVRIRRAPEPVAPCPPGPVRIAAWLRLKVDAVASRRLPEDLRGLYGGILLSITDDIPFELREAFEATGTVHLLSTSGFHLATVAAVVALLLARAPTAVRATGIVVLCALVALASGGGPAPTRAAAMAGIAAAAPLFRRRADPGHALAAAVLLACAFDPEALFDVGAQLSFVTVAALLAAGPYLTHALKLDDPFADGARRVARHGLAALAVGLVAHAASAPLVGFHLHRFSLAAPIANVPAAFLGELVLVVGAVAALADPLPLLGDALWLVERGLLVGLRWCVLAAAAPSGLDRSWASPPAVLVAVASGAIVGVGARLSVRATARRVFDR